MTSLKHDSPGVVIPPPAAFFFFLVAGISAWFAYGGTIPLVPALIRWPAGALIVIAGLLFMRAAHGRFKKQGISARTVDPAAELVTGGAFRFSRNPMYTGFVAILAGLGVFLGAIPVLIAAFLMFLFLDRYAIPREEAYLARTFGERYTAYCSIVRRWL